MKFYPQGGYYVLVAIAVDDSPNYKYQNIFGEFYLSLVLEWAVEDNI